MKKLLTSLIIFFALSLQAENAWSLAEAKAETELRQSEAILKEERQQRLLKRQQYNRRSIEASEKLNDSKAQLSNIEKELSLIDLNRYKSSDQQRKLTLTLSDIRIEAENGNKMLATSHFSKIPYEVPQGDQQQLFMQQLLKAFSHDVADGFLIRSQTTQAYSLLDGKKMSGTSLNIGHWKSLFLSQDLTKAGFLQVRQNSLIPECTDSFLIEQKNSLQKLISGQAATLPIDFTDGRALKYSRLNKGLLQEIKDGGTTVYPLAALALFSLIAFLIKFIQLYTTRVEATELMAQLAESLNSGKAEATEAILAKAGGPHSKLMHIAAKHSDLPHEHLEELLDEVIAREIPKLSRYLSILSVAAAAAPLLGLLGTVMGIIKTFSLMSIFGSGNSDMLASGISEALITTKLGLVVAIPCLLAHALLNRRMRSIASGLERSALSFCNSQKIDCKDGRTQ